MKNGCPKTAFARLRRLWRANVALHAATLLVKGNGVGRLIRTEMKWKKALRRARSGTSIETGD
jgi:hypothetical protein